MGNNKISENSVPTWFKLFNIFALMLILSISIYIISSDFGDFSKMPSGAGDIWWVDVKEINESYYSITDKMKENKN